MRRRRRPIRPSRAMAAAGSEGERRREVQGVDSPPSILGKEARRAEMHGGGRQQAAVAMVALRWGSTASKERRESEREARGS